MWLPVWWNPLGSDACAKVSDAQMRLRVWASMGCEKCHLAPDKETGAGYDWRYRVMTFLKEMEPRDGGCFLGRIGADLSFVMVGAKARHEMIAAAGKA